MFAQNIRFASAYYYYFYFSDKVEAICDAQNG